MARSGRDHNAEEQRERPTDLHQVTRSIQDRTSFQRGHGTVNSGHDDRVRSSNAGTHHVKVPRQIRTPYPEIEHYRIYNLRDSEIKTLAEIGTFRAVTRQDLICRRYSGDADQGQRDLNNLRRQGLIQLRTAQPDRSTYVSLTREGYLLVDNHRPTDMNPRQELYHGFVKLREAEHDAALYRLYQQEAQHIIGDGGKVNRVILDFELKKSINRHLAKLRGLPEEEQARRKQEIARDNGLVVVDGKVPIPDLRLEFEGPDQQQTKVDIELATDHYHRDALAQKARAGFAVFREQSQGGRSAEHDHGLMKAVFSL